MPLSTWQRQDEGIDLVPFGSYRNNGSNGAEFLGVPQRVRRPVASLVCFLKTGSYVGNSYDVFLDVWIQSRFADVWVDVLQFPRRTADGASTNSGVLIKLSATESTPNIILSDTYLTGGSRFHFIGEEWRARYKIFGEHPSTAYEFQVNIIPVG